MVALFLLLAAVIAAAALPALIIPILTAASVAVVLGVFWQLTR